MTFIQQRRDARRGRRALTAGSVGDLVEWYEFGVCGHFATIIAARVLTPVGGSEAEALVKTYASFALAFFFRPVGATLFGRRGDRVGQGPFLRALGSATPGPDGLRLPPRAVGQPARLLLEQPVPTPLMPSSPTPHTVGA